MSQLESSSAGTSEMHVTVAALECLQALLKLMPFEFAVFLLSPPPPPPPLPPPPQPQRQQSTSQHARSASSSSSSNVNSSSVSAEDAAITTPSLQQSTSSSLDVDTDTLVSSSSTRRPHTVSFTMTCEYVAHVLAVKYLLDVDGKRLKSDAEVKVLVKAIALDCCASLIALRPELMLLNCSTQRDQHQPSSDDAGASQVQQQQPLLLNQLVGYVAHTDDKMKASASLLVGQVSHFFSI